MSRIEGITPSKKHQTIQDKRGKYRRHEEIGNADASQRRKLTFVVGISIVVLVAGWIILMQSGALFSSSNSDAEFVTSLTEELNNIDSFQTNNVDTPDEEQLLDEYNNRLFPEFQE